MTLILNCVLLSTLCDYAKCISKIKNISLYRLLPFSAINTERGQIRSVICHFKGTIEDDWSVMKSRRDRKFQRFFLFAPNFKSIASEVLVRPSDFKDVSAPLLSDQVRVNDDYNHRSLFQLRGDVYKNKCASSH